MNGNNKPQQKVVKSSIIQAYEYDAQAYALTVTFKDGSEWLYKGVTPDVMSNVFDRPGSVGSKFIKQIKNGRYQSVKQS